MQWASQKVQERKKWVNESGERMKRNDRKRKNAGENTYSMFSMTIQILINVIKCVQIGKRVKVAGVV